MNERDELIHKTCTTNCLGHANNYASCCTVRGRDWIVGPYYETQGFLDRLSLRGGREWKYSEVFIDFEEGHKMFPEKPEWQNPLNYPAMRMYGQWSPEEPPNSYSCQFLSERGECTVHDITPPLCRTFICPPLRDILEKEGHCRYGQETLEVLLRIDRLLGLDVI